MDTKLIINENNFKSFLINEDDYCDLCYRERCMEILTPTEKLKKHIYQIAVETWGVDLRKIDIPFFEAYIGDGTDKKIIRKSYDLFYSALRFTDFMNYTMQENQDRMLSALTELSTHN